MLLLIFTAGFFFTSEQIFCYQPSQIGPSPRSQYTELANGSLLLKPLSKDHHGGWECLATNRVATVSASTVVMVLGELAKKIHLTQTKQT